QPARMPRASPGCSSFGLGQDRADLFRHLVDGCHAVHRAQVALAEIVPEQRRRLPVVDHETLVDRLRRVVRAPRELGTPANVANTPDMGALEAVVIALATLGAGEAALDASDEL